VKSPVPGPGAYKLTSEFDVISRGGASRNNAFGISKNGGRYYTTDDIPGPGSYLAQDDGRPQSARKGYSFGLKNASEGAFQRPTGRGIPGPGAYYVGYQGPTRGQSAWAASRTARLPNNRSK